MFHIVFYTPKKHSPSVNYYGRRRHAIDRSSTYNQLELDVIRKAIKTRWEVYGFGTRSFQTSIWDLETKAGKIPPAGHIHSYMNGHIITVETAPDVMWFRLNHENVSKNRCQMIEIYRDLDFDWIEKEKVKFMELYTEFHTRNSVMNGINNAQYHLRKVYKEANEKEVKLTDDFLSVNSLFDNCQEEFKKIVIKDKERMDRQSKKIFDYIEGKRTVI